MSNSKIRLKVLSLYKEYKETIMPRKENISLWAETSQNVDYLPCITQIHIWTINMNIIKKF